MSILAECPQCHRKQSVKNKRCKCGGDLDRLKRNQKVKFWINYRLPGGKQKREPVGGEGLNPYSIEDARKAHSKRVVQKAENRILDIKQDTRMTFNELTAWYLNLEKVKALSSFWRVEMALKRFNSVFGDTIVSQIKPADLENYQIMRKREGKADATVDQETGAAKTMIIKGFDNGLISGDTLRVFKAVKKLLKANVNARDRVLSPVEFESLMEHASQHLKGIIAMGYYTGMREGEILNLTWDKIDLGNRVIRLEVEDTKDREARTIPVCDKLLNILKRETRIIRKAGEDKHVFLYKGKPFKDLRGALRKACKKSNILYGRFQKDGFVFHDLRHTFNTYMRKAGVAESVIMEITGHSTRTMFDRYNTVDGEDTRKAVDQFEGFLASVDQTVDQNQEIEKSEVLRAANNEVFDAS